MPHTDTPGVETPAITETMEIAAAQRVEQEKLTRRAALRKLGFGAGIAAFSLLGVDDFARMVGQRLQRNAHDNKTAMAVAKEFQSAGIALAAGPSGLDCCAQVAADKANCLANALQTYAPYQIGCVSLAISCIQLNLQSITCGNEANTEIQQYCAADCSYK